MESFVQQMELEIYGNEEHLTYWEFVNLSDAYSQSPGEDDGFSSWDSVHSYPMSLKTDQIEDHDHDLDLRNHQDHNEVDLRVHDQCDERCEDFVEEQVHHQEQYDAYCDDVLDDDDDDDKEEEEDEDEEHLDDELVPWDVADKFGRQRMRKLGKRDCAKMRGSRKGPYLYVRPGCVYGKHGLGFKHNF